MKKIVKKTLFAATFFILGVISIMVVGGFLYYTSSEVTAIQCTSTDLPVVQNSKPVHLACENSKGCWIAWCQDTNTKYVSSDNMTLKEFAKIVARHSKNAVLIVEQGKTIE